MSHSSDSLEVLVKRKICIADTLPILSNDGLRSAQTGLTSGGGPPLYLGNIMRCTTKLTALFWSIDDLRGSSFL